MIDMFVWKKEFELGIPSIDAQHKELFEVANKIHVLLKEEDFGQDYFDEIMDIIDELRDYTREHFKAEEFLFEKYNYPDSEEHSKEHEAFIAFLSEVDYSEIDHEQKEFLEKLLREIASWIMKHIISSDFMYKDFLIQLGHK